MRIYEDGVLVRTEEAPFRQGRRLDQQPVAVVRAERAQMSAAATASMVKAWQWPACACR